jgi:hypothetical protein
MHDVRLAVRALSAAPVVSVVAALSLALGIGANTAIFSVVNGLMLRSLPVSDPQRLVVVNDSTTRSGTSWDGSLRMPCHLSGLPVIRPSARIDAEDW